ncbi:hypothetical protein GCM10022232_38610 [Streptomyces plumbiresistens]|uniref:Uncharacterized protein n=1 Tax=Streptomyces plumbiresistens TaxID=511811 RepID=A0ABP7RHV6_9ACTN
MGERLKDGVDEDLGLLRSGGRVLGDLLGDGQPAAHRVLGGVESRGRQLPADQVGQLVPVTRAEK